jgi:hypothetical protein
VRRKIVTAVAVGALGLAGVAVAAPALAVAAGSEGSTAAAASPVERIKKALAGLVTDKTLTQAEADKVASTLASADVGRGGPGGPGHGGPGRGGPGGRDLGAAATALGMTETELRTALHSGKSLAQVAKDKNVSVDKLVAALVTAAKERIAQGVTDGRLTQAEADERLAGLTEHIKDHVNRVRPARGADRPAN